MNSIIGIIFGKKNTPWQRIDADGNSSSRLPTTTASMTKFRLPTPIAAHAA